MSAGQEAQPTGRSLEALAPQLAQNIDMLVCPVCGGPLALPPNSDTLECPRCPRSFQSQGGLPLLYWPSGLDVDRDVTQTVKSFYEATPFPNYEDLDSRFGLRKKARRGVFARLLDEQIPPGSKVLEVGCGTGQLTNFLGSARRRVVFGTDISVNSLKLGETFRRRNAIDNAAFLQMNLFKPAFKPGSFDVVICNGVLHHTSEPLLGFQSIGSLVRQGGLVVIGLYNTAGRLPTDVKRLIFRITGDRFLWLDSRLRDKDLNELRRRAWFTDQYRHPHESKHSFGEVMRWFDSTGFQFVNSAPKAVASSSFTRDEQLFAKNPKGSRLDHFIVQTRMLLKGGKEGGLFIMIGRKTC